MKLIVGLGNPGKEYEYSRHNLGFIVVKALADELNCSFRRRPGFNSIIAEAQINNERLLLVLPSTFMNLSGRAVGAIKADKGIDVSDIIVACDDISLAFGAIRIKPRGSSAGHNGLKSIIGDLGTDRFNRLRVGIRNKNDIGDLSGYVLAPFTKAEQKELKEIVSKAVDCVKVWVAEGVDKAMNKFNQK